MAKKPPLKLERPKVPHQPTHVMAPKADAAKPVQVKGQKPATTAQRTPKKVYVVKRGDSLTKIAKAEGTSLSSILALNPRLKTDAKYAGGNKIFAGTRVRVKK